MFLAKFDPRRPEIFHVWPNALWFDAPDLGPCMFRLRRIPTKLRSFGIGHFGLRAHTFRIKFVNLGLEQFWFLHVSQRSYVLGIHAVRVRMQQVGKHFVGLGLFALGLDCITSKLDSFRLLRLCHGHRSTWIVLVGARLFAPWIPSVAAKFCLNR